VGLRASRTSSREAEHQRSEKVQAASIGSRDGERRAGLREFYAEIHPIVGELMYAENFYIVLYDEDRRLMNCAVRRRHREDTSPVPNVWEPMGTATLEASRVPLADRELPC
jgi:hypothetical protein